jgi:ketosteroid isomerase-like protein
VPATFLLAAPDLPPYCARLACAVNPSASLRGTGLRPLTALHESQIRRVGSGRPPPFTRKRKRAYFRVAGPGEKIVRRWYEVVNRSESIDEAMAEFEDLIHPQIESVNPAEAIEGGTRRGQAGIRTAVENFAEGAGRAATIEVEQLLESGDRVLARVRVHARGASSGAEAVGPPVGQVFTIRDGRIFRIEWHYWTGETLDSFERGVPPTYERFVTEQSSG